MESRTEDCVVMLPLGNRTGSVLMLSLKTGRLVNRDQFCILPMPESVIKRLNELALADGRMKGKGEIYTKPTSYEQDSGAKSDLPDTIDSLVNNGVDPAILPLDIHDESDIIDTLNEEQYDNGGEYGRGQQSDDAAGNDSELHGETDEYQELEIREQTHGYDHEIDSLVDDMNRMRAGPRDYDEKGLDGIDSSGVPADYTASRLYLHPQWPPAHRTDTS